MKITIERLKLMGACKEATEFVRRNGLDGVEREWLSGSIGDYGGWLHWWDESCRCRYALDDRGRLLSITLPSGRVSTMYEYDEEGNRIRETDSFGAVLAYAYDDRGNMVEKTFNDGSKWRGTYDERNRLTSEGRAGDPTHTYTYFDDGGFEKIETGRDGRVWRSLYDSHGNLLRHTTPSGGGHTWTYEYDDRGNKLSDSGGGARVDTWTYERDSRDRLVRVMENGEEVLRIAWPDADEDAEDNDLPTNCLAGFSCPGCGQHERFDIDIRTTARVTDDGSEVRGDHEWEDDSPCSCPECNYKATVADFTKEKQ